MLSLDRQLLLAIRCMFPKLEYTAKDEQFYFSNGSLDLSVHGSRHHKGQSGKIIVIGGSQRYHGAPAFAGLSALHMGMDLASVLTDVSASIPVKNQSPDLMVYPHLPSSISYAHPQPSPSKPEPTVPKHIYQEFLNAYSYLGDTVSGATFFDGSSSKSISISCQNYIERDLRVCMDVLGINSSLTPWNCVVIGPGLGKDVLTLAAVAILARLLIESGVPLVLDADALLILPYLVHTLGKLPPNVLITPNAVELTRLRKSLPQHVQNELAKLNGKANSTAWKLEDCVIVTRHMPDGTGGSGLRVKTAYEIANIVGCTVYSKGPFDFITDGLYGVMVGIEGGLKRCGGQGDASAGILAAMMIYSNDLFKGKNAAKALQGIVPSMPELADSLMAGLCCSVIARTSSSFAYQEHDIAMNTMHMIEKIPTVVKLLRNEEKQHPQTTIA